MKSIPEKSILYANKTLAWVRLKNWILKWSLSSRFSNINILSNSIPNIENIDGPILICANHASRWDGPIAMFVIEKLTKMDCYVMLGSPIIRKFPFLTRFGGFEMNTLTPITTALSLNYAASLLQQGRNHCVIIFPQGRYLRRLKRPLDFRPGSAIIARKVRDVRILPVALYYDLFLTESPEAYISFGTPIDCSDMTLSTNQLTDIIEKAVTDELDLLQLEVTNDAQEKFQPLLKGRNSLLLKAIHISDPQWETRVRVR